MTRKEAQTASLVPLFDLDGTLTDPRAGIVRCMRYALDKLGAPCPSDDVLASFIGPSLRKTFATLLETSSAALVEQALVFYREQYGDTGLFENEVYDGIVPVLDHVRRTASAAFVATLKPRAHRVRSIGALWGYGSKAELAGAGADRLCSSPAELVACLSRFST